MNGWPWDMNVFKPGSDHDFAWPSPVPSMNFWLLQVSGMDDSKGSNGSKDLDMHPAHRNLYSFLALLCVRACDSPKRSAPAVVFTCSMSLAIAAFYLVVALWKMENWQDILRILIVRFVLCIWKGFVWQFESIFKLLPQTIQVPGLSEVGMSLPSISLQPSDLAIERLWKNKKNQKCITRNKAWTIPWPG